MKKWHISMYPSGTHIVTRLDPDKPHYYVYADERYQVCEELRDWLNGGKQPAWFTGLSRKTEESVDGPEGIHIYATGPFILPADDNGALNWQVDPAKEKDRIKLIDKLLQR